MFNLRLSLPCFPWILYLINIWSLIVAKTTHWMKAWHRGAAGEHVPVPVLGSCPMLPAHCTSPRMEELPLEMTSWLQTTLAWCLASVENPAPGEHGLQQPGCGYRSMVLPQLSPGTQNHAPGLHTDNHMRDVAPPPFSPLPHRVRRYVGLVSDEGI